jgi:hypothetical protein
VFYINTLVNILIKKNKKQRKKIIEKELENQNSMESIKSESQSQLDSGKKMAKDYSLRHTLEEVPDMLSQHSKLLKSLPSDEAKSKVSVKSKKSKKTVSQKSQDKKVSEETPLNKENKTGTENMEDENFDFVDGIENLSDFEDELAVNSLEEMVYQEEKDEQKKPSQTNISNRQVIAVKGTFFSS